MPTTQLLPAPDQFFATLQELDDYQAKKLSERPITGRTIPWTPRKTLAQGPRGKLLVCHDYKGGYVENPQGLSYTFNYWSLCESFVYFSHHRVTIPPPGWVNAAHRQGVKMLGVLIFEGGAEDECLRLLVGKLPQSSTGSAVQSVMPSTLPISPHYAVALADIAAERGFDGYLLNFECWLQGGLEQARALAGWISLLESELIKRVGAHAEVTWYDSVIFSGSVDWQNRLNSFNLPFFIPSTSFFSNYFSDPSSCAQTAQYFLSVDPTILGIATEEKPKAMNDVYMGVDVWGRGSHGGGGFGCYKAIDHIAPATLGLSVALFAQGWTWESEENDADFTWDKWWNFERDLWTGSPDPNAVYPVPGDTGDEHGPFQPFTAYFPHLPPPDPIDVPFHTTFCPGVGRAWYIEGVLVSKFPNGWMDADKQTTMGDLLWPAPALKWAAESTGTVPDVAVSVNMDDSWNSGTSIKLDFTEKVANPNLTKRSFYVPVQTLSLTTQKSYTASLVYKPGGVGDITDLDVTLSIRPRNNDTSAVVKLMPQSIKATEISNNWAKVTVQFIITDAPPSTITIDSEIGLIVTTVSNGTTVPFSLSVLLGQINVHSTPSPSIDPNFPRILWVDYTFNTVVVPPSQSSLLKQDTTQNLTTIKWIPATALARVGQITITSPDDPRCVWTPEPPLKKEWFPEFLYYNIFVAEPGAAIRAFAQTRSSDQQQQQQQQQLVLKLDEDEAAVSQTGMTWIGTSGADGSFGKGKLEFTFDRTQLPVGLRDSTMLRVFVQGVLETGDVLGWEAAAYVDIRY